MSKAITLPEWKKQVEEAKAANMKYLLQLKILIRLVLLMNQLYQNLQLLMTQLKLKFQLKKKYHRILLMSQRQRLQHQLKIMTQ